MSDVPVAPTTVLDAAAERLNVAEQMQASGSTESIVSLINVLASLGIDPDMPVERLRADLEIAARARATEARTWSTFSGHSLSEAAGWNAAIEAVLGETPQ